MATGRVIIGLARSVARNRAVRAAAVPVLVRGAQRAAEVGGQRYATWRERRRHVDLAIKLARQIQGRYSVDTIIDGRPHAVVWKDGYPVQAFPDVTALAARPELADFDGRLALEPPPPTASGVAGREPLRRPLSRRALGR